MSLHLGHEACAKTGHVRVPRPDHAALKPDVGLQGLNNLKLADVSLGSTTCVISVAAWQSPLFLAFTQLARAVLASALCVHGVCMHAPVLAAVCVRHLRFGLTRHLCFGLTACCLHALVL